MKTPLVLLALTALTACHTSEDDRQSPSMARRGEQFAQFELDEVP